MRPVEQPGAEAADHSRDLLAALERRLVAALEAAQAAGVRIRRGAWIAWNTDEYRWGCCALGALYLETHEPSPREWPLSPIELPPSMVDAMAAELGVTPEWVDWFIDGFDGEGTVDDSDPPELRDALSLGARLARRFVDQGVAP